MTFDKACTEYLNYVKIKNKRSSYRTISNRVNNYIKNYFKKTKITELTPIKYLKWQEYINSLDLKIKYKKTLHVCFVTFLNYCIRFYGLNDNVASKVGNFKGETIDSGNIWSIDEFNKFISVVDDKVYKCLFDLLYFTGLRLGESLALTFNDLNDNTLSIYKNLTRFEENGKKILSTPKTKKSIRDISIDNLLKNEIYELQNYYNKKYADFNNEFFIFGGINTLSPTTVTRKKNYYCKIAKVKTIKIHEFRHSHACLLYLNNVPVSEISYRMGHEKMSMTMDVYLRYIPKDEKRVLNTLNSIRLIN